MKVVITGTPDIRLDVIDAITEILNIGVTSPNNFRSIPALGEDAFKTIFPKFDFKNPILLTFEEYFKYCHFLRNVTPHIENDEFLVILTKLRNTEEYFSASDIHKNIFVDVEAIALVVNENLTYAIAHQVLASVLHWHIKQNRQNKQKYQTLHNPPIGCIMDFCDNFDEIKIKINSGFICSDCVNKSLENNVSPSELTNIFDVLQSIRSKIMVEDFFSNIDFIPNLQLINSDVYIEGEKLKLTEMQLVLYLLFLDEEFKLSGLTSLDFADNQRVRQIVTHNFKRVIAGTNDTSKVFLTDSKLKKIENLLNPDFSSGSFKDLNNEIKERLVKQYGSTLASKYQIQRFQVGYDFKYFINCFFNSSSIDPNC